MGSQYIAQAGPQLEVLLSQPSEYWDYRCVLPHPDAEKKNLIKDLYPEHIKNKQLNVGSGQKIQRDTSPRDMDRNKHMS
jgi:hypothetical protein